MRSIPAYLRIWYFNSQPHKEADRSQGFLSEVYIISTHSLTRRLTKDFSAVAFEDTISTHSLTRRLTNEPSCLEIAQNISTHSLTRRLTKNKVEISVRAVNFNSQPHKEADKKQGGNISARSEFQLTASQGG